MVDGDAPRPAIRVSDAERDATVAMLRDATAEGRLTLHEFGERTERALAATTAAELVALTADLPAPVETAPPRRAKGWIFGILGGGDRQGRWRVAPKLRVINLLGGADLDLRAATVAAPVTEIFVFSLMGGSDIVVPEGVDVELSGFALLGANDLDVHGPPPPPGAPVIRVRAISLMGGTDVATRRR